MLRQFKLALLGSFLMLGYTAAQVPAWSQSEATSFAGSEAGSEAGTEAGSEASVESAYEYGPTGMQTQGETWGVYQPWPPAYMIPTASIVPSYSEPGFGYGYGSVYGQPLLPVPGFGPQILPQVPVPTPVPSPTTRPSYGFARVITRGGAPYIREYGQSRVIRRHHEGRRVLRRHIERRVLK